MYIIEKYVYLVYPNLYILMNLEDFFLEFSKS